MLWRLRRWLRNIAWPPYECENCVGQEPWAGCYCKYHGAPAPCAPTEWWRAMLQRWLEGRGLGMVDVPNARQFVYTLTWLGFGHIRFGLHVHWPSPNIELHMPFFFVRIGWQGVYKYEERVVKIFGKVYLL